jgi:acyl-CoA thioesterase
MRFSEAMQSVTRHGDGWQATVSEDWLQGRSAFGGLQAALALRAMRELVPADMPLRALQVTFIAPVPAGSVAIRAELLRAGRSAIQVEASLCDGEQTLCRLLGVFGSARPSVLDFQPEQSPIVTSTSEELRYVEGRMPAFTQHFGARWLRGDLPFSGGHQRENVLQLSLRDEGPADETHVLAFATSSRRSPCRCSPRPPPAARSPGCSNCCATATTTSAWTTGASTPTSSPPATATPTRA